MKKLLFAISLLTLLTSCGGKPIDSGMVSLPPIIPNSGGSHDSTTDVGSIFDVNFADAKSGQKYETVHGDWVLEVANSSYDGAVKLQYGTNSGTGLPNYLLSPTHDFQGEIKVDVNCYATINDSVVVTDPFEFAVVGLNADNAEIETKSITNVNDMPHPQAENAAVKNFVLTNKDHNIKRVKIVLVTKLTSSNVGIKDIRITNK